MKPAEIPTPVLVTGAGGLIGSAVCAELSRRGARVRAMLAPGESDENVRALPHLLAVHSDLRDERRVHELMEGARAVVHAAALNTLWHKPARDFYSVNVRGTRNVCTAAFEADVRAFVFTSSCEVMGPARHACERLRDETCGHADETRPLNYERVRGHYERSKFLAEMAVREFAERGLPATIIRPTAVIGPGDIHNTPPGMLIRAFLERRIPAYFDAGINVVDSRDVALAITSALARGLRGGTFIVGAHNVRMRELLRELESASGIPAPTRAVGYRTALIGAALRQAHAFFSREHPGITVNGIRTIRHDWFFDTTKAQQEFGLKPKPLSETIRDAVEWHLQKQKPKSKIQMSKQIPNPNV